MAGPPTEDIQSLATVDDSAFSRRGLGKRLLLGASALAVLLAAGNHEDAQAAVGDPWKLGGNAIATNGTEFLGTTNAAPLIFRTSNLERMRILATGNVGIGTTAPDAKLSVTTPTGLAIFGRHTATSGSEAAVRGDTYSTAAGATGVMGIVRPSAPGVNAAGVSGQILGTTVNGAGVRGSHAGSGRGVHGSSANGPGVYGETPSTATGATGVLGKLTAPAPGSDAAGVRGVNSGTNSNGAGVRGTHVGGGLGVHGTSVSGYGVQGNGYIGVNAIGSSYGMYASGGYTGIYAAADTYGVFGYGAVLGVVGQTNTGTGVKGESFSDGGNVNAVYGQAFGNANNGVIGEASNGSSSYGIWGISTSGYAGAFSGNAFVTGTLSKGGGSFKIDHPLEPDTKYLYHSFVESPDMMNVYNGNVTTDAKGEVTVEMPAWFEALNRDFRYQLTVIGQFAQAIIADKIKANKFTIKTDKPNVEVSWQVTGIRQDAFANANRIPVEEDKPAEEHGKYLHPKEHGKPESANINAERVKNLREKNPKRERPPQGPQRTPPTNQ